MNPLLTIISVAAVAGAAWAGWEFADPRASDLFACPTPSHHDGDAIRCAGQKSMRLYSIDAPELPGACRPGRSCTPGDPYASRDHLRQLTSGREVQCRIVDADDRRAGFQAADRYGRPIAQCFVDRRDLSCTMVADGFAVQRYGTLRC